MKKKNRTVPNTPDNAAIESNKQPTIQRGRSSWSIGRIALILAVAGFALIMVLVIPREQQRPAEPLPRATTPSSNAVPASAAPINDVDPTSGKPIVEGITSTYKGYTIGHCCAVSKVDWEALSEAQKDVALQRFLPRAATPSSNTVPASAAPINDVDPTSGKPIVEGITSTYKGYTIGHCCAVSKVDWEELSEAQKDSAIQRFLR